MCVIEILQKITLLTCKIVEKKIFTMKYYFDGLL